MDLKLYQEHLSLFSSLLPPQDAAVLDLACGPGNISCYLLRQKTNLKLTGLDLAPKMLELARKNNPGAEFLQMDFRQLLSLDKKFDGIVCGFGLPYLSREEAELFIRDAAKVLNPNGLFYLSTMEDDYEKSGLKTSASDSSRQLYTYYHQADYLIRFLTVSGFVVLEMDRLENVADDGEVTIDLIIIARLKSI
jgi:ubiquinone/menaquinone biosynthesis C-methylase UbiE